MTATALPATRVASGRRRTWRDLPVVHQVRQSIGVQRFMLVLGLVLTGVFLLVALLAPAIAPYRWAQIDSGGVLFGTLLPPGGDHLLGTTQGGYDVLSRVLWGAQTTLETIVVAVVLSIFVGVALGLVSGYLGGWLDRVLVVVCDAIYAFPTLLLAIVVSIAISGGQSSKWGGVFAAAVSITVVFIPQYFRVIRAEAVRIKAEAYVESAKVVGTSTGRIMVRHVLRNATRTLPLMLTLNCSEALLTLAGLGFLGFGIEPTSGAEWGYDLGRAISDVTGGIWWTGVFPGVAIVLVVLGVTLVGESMNDLADPRLRRRRSAALVSGTATDVTVVPGGTLDSAAGLETPGGAAVDGGGGPMTATPPEPVEGPRKGRRSDGLTDRSERTRPVGPVVDVRDLHVTFASDAGAVAAVDGVSLQVQPGEVLAVVGESGSGKTVTAKSILGLLPESATSSGVVLLTSRDGGDATDVVAVSKKRLREVRGTDVAMVFQEPSTALNPVYTVGWQIAEGIRAHTAIGRREAREQAIDVLRRVGIPDPEHRVDYYPHQFSGGQKQRVVIAMALVLGPGLIVADEPTTALDVTVQAEILDLLRSCRDEGTSILLITHNLGVVADLSDRVVVMYGGEVVEQASTAELFAHPQQEYTKKLLAAVPYVGQGRARTVERAAARETAHSDGSVPDAVVQADGLRITYPGRLGRAGFTAVDGVSFTVRAGEVLGLVGESGSGKTTIGRAIAGLTRVTGGSLTVLGQEMRGVKERTFRPLRRDIGFVFQDPASSFNPLLTIAACVAEPLIVHGRAKDADAARPRVDELLEAVQLPKAYGDRYPHELSGGQRQRASLARSLALEPKLLIADEPTSALDVSVQARVLELFAELQAELGFASLFISHDLAVVDLLADRIAVLYHGRLVEEGTGEQVLEHPQHPYTQRLLASLPVPDPVAQAGRRAELARLRATESPAG